MPVVDTGHRWEKRSIRAGGELILASASPRRRTLLAALGLAFQCVPAKIDESPASGERPEDLVRRLSLAKAQAVARSYPGATVIGADTIVVLDDAVLGKPATPERAMAMLQALRGRAHEVLTAVSVCRGREEPLQRLNRSRIWMRTYTDEEIAAYVASRDPLDKAGAYAIQHPGFRPVERWEGCYASIVGLPLADVAELLQRLGWRIPTSVAQACHGVTGVPCCQE
ncbi:MAG: septum formation protein Maf [Anaerolineae bacterium]|nr:septum formation protein Maf [Anaerolineae bacterium]